MGDTVSQLENDNGRYIDQKEQHSSSYENIPKPLSGIGRIGLLEDHETETDSIEDNQNEGAYDIEEMIQFAFERLELDEVVKEEDSGHDHKKNLSKAWDIEDEDNENEGVAVEEEQRVEESSSVLLRTVGVLVDLTVFWPVSRIGKNVFWRG